MKTVQVFKTAIAAATLVLVSGCASLFTDSATAINVQTSNGQKVKVTIEGTQFDVPGMVIANKNGLDKVLTTNASNCENGKVLETKLESVFWLDVLMLSPASTTTDSLTDKMWTYEEDVIINCTNG